MKRALLNTLAIFFALGFFGGLFLIITGNLVAGALVAIICMMMTPFLLKAAERAPIRKSRLLRTTGLLGGVGLAMVILVVLVF